MILGVSESLAVWYVPASYLNDVTAILPMGLLIASPSSCSPSRNWPVGRVVRLRPPKPASLRSTCSWAPLRWSCGDACSSAFVTGNNLYTLGRWP